ncbi:MAG: O-succinylbenzoate-CoA ligase [Pseudomonadota bacterium]|jgi:O-succinylbenzoic acid--CoA ligase
MGTDFGVFEFTPYRGEFSVLLDPRFGGERERTVKELLRSVSPEGSGVWIASSGTTRRDGGEWRFLALPEEALWASATAANQHIRATSDDVFVSCLPDFHVGGLGLQVRAHVAGARFVRGAGNERRWGAQGFVDDVKRSGGTIVSLVPTQVIDLVREGLEAPGSVRAAIVGGGAISTNEYCAGRALGWPLLPSFGFTECASQVATAELKSLENRPGEVPPLKLLSHIEARIADDVLELRSPALFTAAARIVGDTVTVSERPSESWYRTSDRVELIGEAIRPLGRVDELVKVGGEGVNLQELSLMVRDIRAGFSVVGDVALQANDDPRLGKVLILFTTDSTLGEAIKGEFNARVLPCAQIRDVRVVEIIERTSLGKIRSIKEEGR